MYLPLTPIRFLYRAAELFGGKTGIICGDQRFTYSEFAARAERLAGFLSELGVAAGDRVAYLSFNTHKLLEGYYGAVMAGGIVMPLNVRLSVVELTNILNHSGARILLYEDDFAGHIEAFRANCPGIEHYVPLAGDARIQAANRIACDWLRVEENSVAELFYTSGSTGAPKGVALSHRTLYLHALYILPLFREAATMVDLHTIPLFHANGWGRPQSSTMMGTKQVMVRRFDPAGVLRLIETERATDMCLVPTMANALLNCPELPLCDVSSMRQIFIGGAASSPELIARLEDAFGCSARAGYGLTETAPIVTSVIEKGGIAYRSPFERQTRQAMTGWAAPGSEMRVADADGNDVPKDGSTIGEILVRSDNVMDGYYREPEATAAVMANGWFHTGDMAVWDEHCHLHIVDRKKEIIISGGENISSIEVEKAIGAHPAVYECAVVAAPDPQWGEVPAAIIVLKPAESLDQAALIAFLEQRLGKFKLPRIVEFVSEPLPKTGTGKIRKMDLRERYWSGKEKRVQG